MLVGGVNDAEPGDGQLRLQRGADLPRDALGGAEQVQVFGGPANQAVGIQGTGAQSEALTGDGAERDLVDLG